MSLSPQEENISRSSDAVVLVSSRSSHEDADRTPLMHSRPSDVAFASSQHDIATRTEEKIDSPRSSADGSPQRSFQMERECQTPLMNRPPPPLASVNEKPVSWASLPRKGQLAILIFARFSEPLAQTSLMAYMFYQLRWFDPSLPDSTISWQAGILQASFSAAQFFTAALWGRAADRIGRKPIILIGLGGSCLSCFAYAFSTHFAVAVVIRLLGGALNGNVGLMRTMISEIVPEKKYQSRAFLLLPTFLNIGGILGPIMGGFFADPVKSLPKIFGPHSLLGGTDGVLWMGEWPYALPSLLAGTVLFSAIVMVFLGLDETHEHIKNRRDRGRQIARWLLSWSSFRRSKSNYSPIHNGPEASSEDDLQTTNVGNIDSSEKDDSLPVPSKLPFRQVWTHNVVLSLASHFFLILNISTFNALLYTFLPAPRSFESTSTSAVSTSRFSGGLGLSESNVGLATSLIGLLGFPFQLILYPFFQSRYGTLGCFKLFLPFSTLAAFLNPLLVLLPQNRWVVWPCLTAVLALQVLAGTQALPGSIILINESIPTAQVKGLIHGVGQSVASAGKTVGPVLGGWGLSMGLQHNTVEAVWWTLGSVTLLGWICAWAIRERKASDEEEARRTS